MMARTTTIHTSQRKSKLPLLLLAALLVFLVIAGLILSAAPSSQGGSTYSRSSTGYRGWYDYMLQQQRPVKHWRRSYDQLSGSGQTLIRVGGESFSDYLDDDFFRSDVKGMPEVQSWLENGNTLIQLTWQGKVTAAPFSSQLVAGGYQVHIDTTRRHTSFGDNARSQGAKSNQDLVSELQDQFGAVIWSRPIGKGTLISCTYPWLAANALADQPDNYRFLATLAQRQEGPIWVDEWMHGYREPSETDAAAEPQNFIDYLARTPVIVMVAQICFLLLLLIWGHNHRFGALITLKPEVKDASEQYIQALASTMNAARQTGFVTQMLGQYFQHTLATRLGLVSLYGSEHQLPDPDQLSSHWSEVTGRPATELLELLQPAVRSDQELLVWVANVESLLRELP